jgi:hypothetical protein
MPFTVELLLGAQGRFDSGTCVARLDAVLLNMLEASCPGA